MIVAWMIVGLVALSVGSDAIRIDRGKEASEARGHPRCRDSVDGLISMAVKAASPLERHSSTSSHGDVCRNAETQGFFCPSGCEHSPTVPYCAETICGHPTPCRVAPDPLNGVAHLKVKGQWQGQGGQGLQLATVAKTNAVMERSGRVGREVLNVGANCFQACRRQSCCADFCGTAGACCKLGDPLSSASEACFNGRIGCPNGHCCVAAHHD